MKRKEPDFNRKINKEAVEKCNKCSLQDNNNMINSLCKEVIGTDGEKIRCVGKKNFILIFYRS